MTKYFGFGPPFLTDDAVLPKQTDERLIKNDIIQLLLTAPGERIMRPTFGSPIKPYLFENMTPADTIVLKRQIIDTITTFDGRVDIRDVSIVQDPDNNTLSISIQCSLNINAPTTFVIDASFSTINSSSTIRSSQ